jgi:hypothetical protein
VCVGCWQPHNVMIDHEKRKLRLIDWGLAEVRTPTLCRGTRMGGCSDTLQPCLRGGPVHKRHGGQESIGR